MTDHTVPRRLRGEPDDDPLARLRRRSRASTAVRLDRWRSKRWVILQCAIAAGVSWELDKLVLHHSSPVFAPVAAVVSLGTSYGQRLRRVAEVTLGVSVGVFLSDLLVNWLGGGPWQLMLLVVLAFSITLLLDAGSVFVNQAAVQSIFVFGMAATPGAAWTRWLDGLVGGLVALVAATVAPAAPLRRPRERAAVVVRKIAELLRAASGVMTLGEGDLGYDVLTDARSTDRLIRELQAAAAEGMGVVTSSPFRRHEREHIRRMADLVEPLDRAMRSTRVLVRQVAVAAHRGRRIPDSYVELALQLARAVDAMAVALEHNEPAEVAQPALVEVARASGRVERTELINAEAVLAQMRSVIVDLLVMTGMDELGATDVLPPLQR